MRPTTPLPAALREGVFTRRGAEALGVPPKRLRAQDVARIGHGLYRWNGGTLDDGRADAVGLLPRAPQEGPPDRRVQPDGTLLRMLRQIQDEYTGSWFSHTTAARLHGLQLPGWAGDESVVHLSRPQISTTTRRSPQLRSHAVVIEPGEVVDVAGLRVSRPGRVFFDLMGALPERELVALGDQLVRRPHAELEGRDEPWETPSSLATLVAAHRRTKGIVKGRRALDQVRIGADSRPETLLRLAILDAGLPEPQLQVRPRPGSPWSGDLGYEDRLIVLQYEGAGHFSAAQQARDQRRNFAFVQDGWTVLPVNVEDLRDGFRRVVARLLLAFDG